jgi:hypothetical protein
LARSKRASTKGLPKVTTQPLHRALHQRGGWLRRGRDLSRPDPSNRRRRIVFLATLVAALAVSLGYTWLRPAEYRASARIEITPAAAPAPAPPAPGTSGAGPAPESARPFLTEVQILTSRPVLEQVAARMERQGRSVSAFGADPVAGMQSVLEAIPVPSTNVVELVERSAAAGERGGSEARGERGGDASGH